MSSLYVRNMVRGWLPALATPYHDSINREATPGVDDPWLTLDFQPEYSEVSDFCRNGLEEGTIDFIFSGRAGTGDNALLTAVEADMRLIAGQVDPTGRLVIRNVEPPEEYTDGDADRYYRIVAGVEYTCYSQ